MELSSSAVGSGKFIAAHLHIAFSPLRDNRRRAGRTFPQTGRMAMSATGTSSPAAARGNTAGIGIRGASNSPGTISTAPCGGVLAII